MFMGLPILLSFIALSTNVTAFGELQLRDGMAVTIEISGDVAEEYVRVAKPEPVPESFRTDGTLMIEGIVRSTSEESVELRHKAVVAEIGQPIRRATFEATINRGDINVDDLKLAAENDPAATLLIRLPNNHARFTIQRTPLLGDFPERARAF